MTHRWEPDSLEPDCVRALGNAGRPGLPERLDLLANDPGPSFLWSCATGEISPLLCILLSRMSTYCLTNRSPRVNKGREFLKPGRLQKTRAAWPCFGAEGAGHLCLHSSNAWVNASDDQTVTLETRAKEPEEW